ncbi:DNA-binding protein SMUBP-2 [Forsythia ovata]|uniref:DNA-binding protein SMUBP-2 n=1 Tax=Forsythia ovata TaxID=205694 RepID=A0ABD1V0F6_9LAMI
MPNQKRKKPGALSLRLRHNDLISLYSRNNRVLFGSPFPHQILATRSTGTEVVSTKRITRKIREDGRAASKKNFKRVAESSQLVDGRELCAHENGLASMLALYQNGEPTGRSDLGKGVVKWICQGMKEMASDFAMAEMQGEFSELSTEPLQGRLPSRSPFMVFWEWTRRKLKPS